MHVKTYLTYCKASRKRKGRSHATNCFSLCKKMLERNEGRVANNLTCPGLVVKGNYWVRSAVK